MNLPAPPRDFRADLVRAAAACLVVGLHVSMDVPAAFGARWWAGMAAHASTRVAVPLFVLLSGALLLGRVGTEPLMVFARKRVRRILVPLLVSSAIFLAWRHFYYAEPLGTRFFLEMLLGEPAYYHLWFFYLILALMLFVPWLRATVNFTPARSWVVFAAAWLFALAAPPLVRVAAGVTIASEYFLAGGYGGYFLLGPVLAHWQPDRRRLVSAAVLFAGLWLATVLATRALTCVPSAPSIALLGFLKPNVALMALAVFVLLWHWAAPLRWPLPAQRLITSLSRTSLGIYILHPIPLELGANGWLGPWWRWIGGPGQTCVLIAGCAVFTTGVQYLTKLCASRTLLRTLSAPPKQNPS